MDFLTPRDRSELLSSLTHCIDYARKNDENHIKVDVGFAEELWQYLASIWNIGSLGQLVEFYQEDGWLEKPLPAKAPEPRQKLARVEWLRQNLSRGEMAMLYRLAHDVDKLDLANCKRLEREEKL